MSYESLTCSATLLSELKEQTLQPFDVFYPPLACISGLCLPRRSRNENESNFVELKMVKCATLTEVLQFIYTGEAKVDISNAQDLIMAADYLIIPTL